MIAVILAAGKSQRFIDRKYLCPKALLPVDKDGKMMVVRVAESLSLRSSDHLYIVASSEHHRGYGKIFEYALLKIGEPHRTLAWIPAPNGEVDTILRLKMLIGDEKENLLINYCDTWLEDFPKFLNEARSCGKPCSMTVFKSDDPRFKRSINGDAFGGTFYFESAEIFFATAATVKVSGINQSLTDVVKRFEHNFCRVVLGEEMIDLGIPDDYENYIKTIAKVAQ